MYVVAHRYHTGIMVRAADVPQDAWPARVDLADAEYLELGWGEREYYIRDEPGVWRGLRALLIPSRSTVEVIAITGLPDRTGDDREMIELRVPRSGFERLIEFVRQSHDLDAQGRGVIVAVASRERGIFYASPRTFHGLENCNVWVARGLEAAQLPIRPGTALTAGMLLRPVRRLSDEMSGRIKSP
ncbi:MAG: DUF2459 domain-containing protein [Rhodospirillaceae bacterium]